MIMNRRSFLALFGAGLGAAAALAASPEKPKVPLRVTYYYLPG